jgi:hypothetical protein
MEDGTHTLVEKAQELGDLELAVLLCLISDEHCIIEADAQDLDQAEKELQSLCDGTFGFKSAVLRLSKDSIIEDFSVGVLVPDDERVVSPIRARGSFFALDEIEARRNRASAELGADSDGKRVADVVIVRDLHLACSSVQIQALEVRCYVRMKRCILIIRVAHAKWEDLYAQVDVLDSEEVSFGCIE